MDFDILSSSGISSIVIEPPPLGGTLCVTCSPWVGEAATKLSTSVEVPSMVSMPKEAKVVSSLKKPITPPPTSAVKVAPVKFQTVVSAEAEDATPSSKMAAGSGITTVKSLL